jgi:hypothetical protein
LATASPSDFSQRTTRPGILTREQPGDIHRFPGGGHKGDGREYLGDLAGRNDDLDQNAVHRRLDLEDRLLGFDLADDLPLGHRLAFGLQPTDDPPFHDVLAALGHDDLFRHVRFPF